VCLVAHLVECAHLCLRLFQDLLCGSKLALKVLQSAGHTHLSHITGQQLACWPTDAASS
jgi:hypothetical protein